MYTHSIPDGLTPAQFKAHPVREVIFDAAYHGKRGLPTSGQLDALDLSSVGRAAVLSACREAAAIHDGGDQQDAWQAGDREAARIIGLLPEDQRDPGYLREPEPEPQTYDPVELAAQVSRFDGLRGGAV